MTTRITPREIEMLSAYLDGQLTNKERTRLERDLQKRADLRALLEDLQRTRGLLHSQPVIRAPRNFTLTPQMAGMKTFRPVSRRLVPAFSLVSVMAAALFMLVLVGDLLSVGRQPALFQVASRSVPLPVEVEAPAALDVGALESSAERQVETEALLTAAPAAESAFAFTTPTPAPESTLPAPMLAEVYPPPREAVEKSADTVQGATTTAALSMPYPAPQPTVVAQAEELPAEEPVEGAARVTQPPPQPRWQTWRVAEFALGFLTISFGAFAYILSRSRRV